MESKKVKNMYLILLPAVLFVCLFVSETTAQTSSFTYQGKLTDTAVSASGPYDFTFKLFDAATNGTQVGVDLVANDVPVAAGIFTVNLNFGASAFADGAPRFLQIEVRPGASTGSYTTLAPRQQITSSPFAIKSLGSASADSLSPACTLCVTDVHILSIDGAKVTGTVANSSNAVNATTAGNVTGVVAIANGGTGSSTKNFVDLSTNQTVGGSKTFTGIVDFGATPPSGRLGQPLATAYSTSSVSPGSTLVQIPGLSVTIDVPTVCASGSTVCTAFVTADGGVQTTSASTTGVSRVDVTLALNGELVPNGAYKRVIVANTGGSVNAIENWSFAYTTPISPGQQTFAVMTSLQSGSPATVGGGAGSVLQGSLTVIIIRR